MKRFTLHGPDPRRAGLLPLLLFSVAGSWAMSNSRLWAQTLPQLDIHNDSGGTFATYQPTGVSSTTGPFFQSLGTNGRTCATCHVPADGFGLSISDIQTTFNTTGGTDPLFAAVDGADCIDQPSSHNMLLNHGLIRILLPISPKTFTGAIPNFTITVNKDLTNCQLKNAAVQAACVAQFGAGFQCISVYRRPQPATNLNFQSVLTWDGREPSPSAKGGLTSALTKQASDATVVHAQATTKPTAAQLAAIESFEAGLYTSQETDNNAGALNSNGATEAAESLPSVPFFFGVNQVTGTGGGTLPTFNSDVFTFFNPWSGLTGTDPVSLAQESIARGQNIFNNFQFQAGPSSKDVSTCSSCHNDPSIGNNSQSPVLMAHTGSDSPSDPVLSSGTYLPTFTLTCNGQTTGTATTDPGRALISGNCGDVAKVKVPTLHALLAHPPYFRAGSAPDLSTVVKFYNNREKMSLTAQQKTDLINFLGAL